ncbi:MAG: alanine dehydrogenase [Bernardetiaceae bacterium]|nr:alanine dehydrogenase [Bernardetiaceae bacterium]
MVKIALLREEKVPIDRRVAITPAQCAELQNAFHDTLAFIVQPSDIRCFSDDEYREAGIQIQENIQFADILIGVKEVPVSNLLMDKIYLFFSHTTKMQPYNKGLLRKILDERIELIDYEMMTDEEHKRIIAFGRYAGIVGAYNGIWTYGKKFGLFDLKRAYQCHDMAAMWKEFEHVKLDKNCKIVVTGGGRVAQGAMEVLDAMKIRQVGNTDFLDTEFDEPVYTQLDTHAYNKHKEGKEFDVQGFYKNPEDYESNFLKYTKVSDLFIAAAYWDPKAPVLFTKEDMRSPDFKIKVIADITCDIEGSIPSTLRPTTIDEPLYDYDPESESEKPPLSNKKYVTVMAIDNLPCELPRDASTDFGKVMADKVIPAMLNPNSKASFIERATITKEGKLAENYMYLKEWVYKDKA